MRGLRLGLSTLRSTLMGSFAKTIDFYVSSLTGSDANPGTLAAPFLTLAKAQSVLTANKTLAMVRGSLWRESFNPAVPCTIIATGAGAAPIINGSDIATTWVVDGTANVWDKTGWTHDGTLTSRLTIYENGILLKRVADVATCGTTAGSFVDIKGSTGTPLTLQIHTSDGTNPNTNGKTYEASRRMDALAFPNTIAATVTGIQTMRQIRNDGSAVFGPNAAISSIVAVDGTKHNLLFSSGTVTDCIAYAADPPTSYETASTNFIVFAPDTTGLAFTFNRCGAFQQIGPANTLISAFYAHSANASLYVSGTLRQCWATGDVSGGHPANAATTQLEEGCYWNCLGLIGDGVVTVRYSTAFIPAKVGLNFSNSSLLSQQTFQHCAYAFEVRQAAGNNNEAFRPVGAAHASVMTNCALFMGGPATFGNYCMNNSTATGGTQTTNNTIIFGFEARLLQVATGVTYIGNYNVFLDQNATASGFEALWQGTTYSTLATWQAATGQDAQSVRLDPADQVAAGANAFWLAYKNAPGATNLTTIGPQVGDFRINPSARVYSGGGTAYIGTYPDGTSLVSGAGPQLHWDWNVRGAVAGPPIAFPNVPQTLANSQSYAANPTAWVF